jgi:hypothetical protein
MLGTYQKQVMQIVNRYATVSEVFVQNVLDAVVAIMPVPAPAFRDDRRVRAARVLQSLVEHDLVVIDGRLIKACSAQGPQGSTQGPSSLLASRPGTFSTARSHRHIELSL